MKIDFNKPLLDLDGKELPDTNIGKILANVLCSQTKGDALKLYDWGRSMYKGEILDLDRADQDLLKSQIKDSESLTILAKAQMLELITV